MQYEPQIKPLPSECPGRFCFDFGYPVEALKNRDYKKSPMSCQCSFGLCTRLDPENGDHDWYEPCEPELQAAGLPWFYFTPSPLELVEDMREEYVAESENLWGKKHWEK